MVSLNISFPDDGDLPHAVIKALAETKNCQFEDMLCVKTKDGKEQAVPLTQRRFRNQMQSANDCGRMLRILKDEVNTMWERESIKDGATSLATNFEREQGMIESNEWWKFAAAGGQEEVRRQNLDTAKERLKGWLTDVERANLVIQQNQESMNRFKEEQAVTDKSERLLRQLTQSQDARAQDEEDQISLSPSKGGMDAPMLEMQGQGDLENSAAMGALGNIGHIIGCIPLTSLEGMRSGLNTAMRSNVFVVHEEIGDDLFDPATGELVPKCVFAIYYHGEGLSDKILRFSRAYGATIYTPPENGARRTQKMMELSEEIRNRETAQEATMKDKYHTLEEFYVHAITLRKFIAQEKLIFFTLNKCSDKSEDGAHIENRTITRLRALVWVPKAAVPRITGACERANSQCKDASTSGGASLVMVKEVKVKAGTTYPTFSPTNMFTEGFQAIVDGYGIPDYKEINPTIFATAMFPFLFGVMFGDLVHGTLMTIFAALLIFYEDKFLAMEELNEIFEYLFSGRYTIFTMGICATYMGMIYNEALSCSMNLWGSAYDYSYVCVSSYGASEEFFPEFGGNVMSATEEATATQFSAFGCTVETLAAADSCWKLLGQEKYFEQLPCGVNSNNPCSDEIKEIMETCKDAQGNLIPPSTSAIVIKMEPFVVPAGHGERDFLPTDVGQPIVKSHINGTIHEEPATQMYNTYKFGVDPVWRYSSQNIQFTNSLKMKMSVILGVSQMLVGIILKWFNKIHFQDYGTLCAVCVPELLFMSCTFGYMCILIFIKWSTDYAQGEAGLGVPCYPSCSDDYASEYGADGCFREPPMIITTLIGMFMSVGAVGQDQANAWDKCKFYLFESQESLQFFFLMVALVCIPWLFAVQPVLVYKAHEKEVAQRTHRRIPSSPSAAVAERQSRGGNVHMSEDSASDGDGDDPEDDGFVMGDVIVGQAIHAIEFILGAVSNTASYLRLWALSLAHSQLSEVFWEYIFKGYEIELLGGQYPGLASNNVAFIIVCYALFFCCTIAVLMVMESLSAFLHALRLQWVEFQNKFYSATGYKFTPLDFDDTSMNMDMEQ